MAQMPLQLMANNVNINYDLVFFAVFFSKYTFATDNIGVFSITK